MGNCMGSSKCATAPTPLESKVTRSSISTLTTATTDKASRRSSSAFSSAGQFSRASSDEPQSPAAPALSSLKSFNMSDLRAATKNFGSNSFLGEGGFGCVYKGWIDEITLAPTKPGVGKMVAIKKLKKESFQGHKEWLAEVTYLGQLHHENLVNLVGYCSDSDSNKLLVYEYMLRGSLENHLFRRGTQPLSWPMRVNIAVDVARGLSFLHGLENPIIFRDLKSSNVLLAGDYRAKLSDFGLARNGPTGDKSHVSTRVVGTRGYAAPEYVATGHLSVKSDVYSFGVVLLELLTGRRAADGDVMLVEWARPYIGDRRKVSRVMDTRLGGQYPKRQAHDVAALAMRCLHHDPRHRPAMPEALQHLQLNAKPSFTSSFSSAAVAAPARRSTPPLIHEIAS
uniref:non-specific serine/threonine protein kinase n=1 Tax=Leersia perrieri TaxID=77586 RepID=A0A0D9X333_9ORYZ